MPSLELFLSEIGFQFRTFDVQSVKNNIWQMRHYSQPKESREKKSRSKAAEKASFAFCFATGLFNPANRLGDIKFRYVKCAPGKTHGHVQ